jgi:hypothetical protein
MNYLEDSEFIPFPFQPSLPAPRFAYTPTAFRPLAEGWPPAAAYPRFASGLRWFLPQRGYASVGAQGGRNAVGVGQFVSSFHPG